VCEGLVDQWLVTYHSCCEKSIGDVVLSSGNPEPHSKDEDRQCEESEHEDRSRERCSAVQCIYHVDVWS
jgi:hypothetical protein